MHGDAQFASSSSVPARIEMMGLIGMGLPMAGASVAVAVSLANVRLPLNEKKTAGLFLPFFIFQFPPLKREKEKLL